MNPNLSQIMAKPMLITLAEADSEIPKDQWIHLLPIGKFFANDGRGPFIVEDANDVIAESIKRAGSKLVPVDYDHQIDHATKNGQPAPAAGWISKFESRDNGVWGLVEWTERARSYLSAKEYRYLSPVLSHDEKGDVICIRRAALTNKPALELTALASEQESSLVEELFETRKKLQAALAETESIKKESKEKEIDSLLTEAVIKGRMLPFQREFAAKLCRIDTGLFKEFVSISPDHSHLFKEIDYGEEIEDEETGGLHTSKLSEVDKTVCKAMGHTQKEFIQLGANDDH